MTLHELIGKGKLEKFKKPSFAELNDKLKLVYAHLKTAEILLKFEKGDENINKTVYLSIYNAIRLTLLIYVGFKGYRTKGQQHHKTTILAAKFFLNDESLEALFTRAQRMSKNRNKIDYDIKMFDISDASIKQSLKDGKKLLNRVNKEIESKNPQGKLNL